jgi:hypothetical protein
MEAKEDNGNTDLLVQYLKTKKLDNILCSIGIEEL